MKVFLRRHLNKDNFVRAWTCFWQQKGQIWRNINDAEKSKQTKKKNKDKMSVISTTIAKNYRDCELPWQQQQKQVVIKNLQILFAFVYII